MSTPSIEQLRRAIQIREQITKLEAEIKSLLGGMSNAKPPQSVAAAKPGKTKRTMSPEARAKIAAAAKKRWAGIKGTAPATSSAASPASPKPAAKAPGAKKKAKRNITPEGRAKMAAAAKKRWAGVKKKAV